MVLFQSSNVKRRVKLLQKVTCLDLLSLRGDPGFSTELHLRLKASNQKTNYDES